MLFSPLISYYTQTYFGINSNTVFGVLTYPLLFLTLVRASYNKDLNIGSYVMPGFLFGIYLFIWSYYNGEIHSGEMYSGLKVVLLNNRYLQSTAILVLIYNTSIDDRFISTVIFMFKLTVFVAFIVTIIQITLDPFFLTSATSTHEYWYLRHNSVITNQNVSIYGFLWHEIDYSFLPIVTLLTGYLILTNKKFIIYIFLGALVAIGTNSRTTMLAFITASLPYIWNHRHRFTGVIKYIALGLVGLLIFMIILNNIGYDLHNWVVKRLMSDSYTTRINAFIAVAQHIPENIWFGTGSMKNSLDVNWKLKMFGGTQIHNAYLAHFVYQGILGLGFLMWFYFALLKKLLWNARKTKYYASLIGYIIFLQVQLTTIPFGGIFAYGLIYCFIFDKYYYDKLTIQK